jgi:hypothetical protein
MKYLIEALVQTAAPSGMKSSCPVDREEISDSVDE